MSHHTETLSESLRKVSLRDEKEDKNDDRLWDEEGRVPRDPVKMNKTLEKRYILKHEPWEALPSTYFPIPKYNHRPPYFLYGFGFRWLELERFAIKMQLCRAPEEVGADSIEIRNAWYKGAVHLMRRAGDFGVYMEITSPYSREAQVVLRLWDNYSDDIPPPGPEKILKAIDFLVEILAKCGMDKYPKWYISKSYWQLPLSGYGAAIDFTQYLPPVPATAA